MLTLCEASLLEFTQKEQEKGLKPKVGCLSWQVRPAGQPLPAWEMLSICSVSLCHTYY